MDLFFTGFVQGNARLFTFRYPFFPVLVFARFCYVSRRNPAARVASRALSRVHPLFHGPCGERTRSGR